MSGRSINPELLAEQLGAALLPSGAAHVGAYFKAVRPDEAERTRMMFSMLLFPVTASYGMIHTTTNPDLKDALIKAHDIYLGRIREQDQLVNLGDYIIWRVERDSVARELRERYSQLIVPSGFDTHQVRHGLLLRVVADVRKQTFLTDLHFGVSQTTDGKQGMMLAFRALGTTFTRHVLKIDPTGQNLAQWERERYEASIAYASALHAHGFFEITEVFKALGA